MKFFYNLTFAFTIIVIIFIFIKKADISLNGRAKAENKKIRIALNEWAGYAPIAYAEVLGLYKKYNLPFEIKFIANPNDMYELYKKGKLDAFAAVLADVISLRAEGVDGKVVLLTDYSLEGDAIVANKKYRSVRELKGKTIGINQLNSFSHLLVLEALKQVGLTERDVNLRIIPFDQVPQALDQNLIEAGHTWDPGKKIALEKGYKSIFMGKDVPGLISEGILFHDDILLNNKEIIKKFVDVFYQAQTEMRKDPIGSSEKMKLFFKNNPTDFAKSFSEIHFIDKSENAIFMDAKKMDSIVYKNNKKINLFLEERGQANNKNLYKEIMTEDFLK